MAGQFLVSHLHGAIIAVNRIERRSSLRMTLAMDLPEHDLVSGCSHKLRGPGESGLRGRGHDSRSTAAILRN